MTARNSVTLFTARSSVVRMWPDTWEIPIQKRFENKKNRQGVEKKS